MGYWTPAPSSTSSSAPIAPSAASYSDLGVVAGGSTVAAGSALPAVAGRLILHPGTNWVKITGTAAEAGDLVVVEFEGLRSTFPLNPAQRRKAGAGPGASGSNPLALGEIEVTISGSNADANYVHWFLVRTPV